MRNNYDSVIDSDFFPAKNRFEYCVDAIKKSSNPFNITSGESENFDAKVSIKKLGETCYFLSEGCSPVTAWRTDKDIALVDDHPFHLIMPLTNFCVFTQRKTDAELEMGDFVLIDTKQEFQATMSGTQGIFLSIPDAIIRTWIPNPENYVGQTLRGNTGWSIQLSSYFRNLNTMISGNADRRTQIIMIEHILSIFMFALEESHIFGSPIAGVYLKNKDLYKRMHSWLRANYMDPEITASGLASRFNISTKELHRQFANTADKSTFFSILRSMRLTAAIAMLKDSSSKLTISEIGFRSGFIDSAYFGRVFKKFLKCSPGRFTMELTKNTSQ
ncbi:AraC family transcriptional regulator [Glaciimonas sp. PAMC28666]|uniref:helix-turn-helix domain-containing protein n=1 Tax=Glaciimonas sp. PAMC28666 TaxID=2807626 RepID=UPI001962A289|nr:AraC family transcriptional regulator [Glaciimonas sp. PAMC28666]QRX83413.1 AraC family transcriptional regulator [Glaciimonas sp. PAMC28666]